MDDVPGALGAIDEDPAVDGEQLTGRLVANEQLVAELHRDFVDIDAVDRRARVHAAVDGPQ